jgi:ribosomal protein L11 methyltransferase
VPYRLDLFGATVATFDYVVELGALDAEFTDAGALAALMPDSVDAARVAGSVGIRDFRVSPAIARDAGSTWLLRPREVRVGGLRIVPSDARPESGTLRLVDSSAFGTGLHPTTALCLEALQNIIGIEMPDAMLDVGTGSGVLALAALMLGVPRALGIDIEEEALLAAAGNARLNELGERMQRVRGGPEAIAGTWPLVVANILAAPLIEMAPALVRRVGHHGQLVLSGIPASVEQEVADAYRHRGMHMASASSRDGWAALVLQAGW